MHEKRENVYPNDSNNSFTLWFQIICDGARIIRIWGVREIIRGPAVFESLWYIKFILKLNCLGQRPIWEIRVPL